MPRGAGELLLVSVEEGRNRYREVVHDLQPMPSGKCSLSFCGSLTTMEEGEGEGPGLVGIEFLCRNQHFTHLIH